VSNPFEINKKSGKYELLAIRLSEGGLCVPNPALCLDIRLSDDEKEIELYYTSRAYVIRGSDLFDLAFRIATKQIGYIEQDRDNISKIEIVLSFNR